MRNEVFIKNLESEFKRIRWTCKIEKTSDGYLITREFRNVEKRLIFFKSWKKYKNTYHIFNEWIKDMKTMSDQEFLIKIIKKKLRGK